MKAKRFIGLIALTVTATALTSCNSVSLAIKTKGEEVSAQDWADSYLDSYDKNLDDFENGIFNGYSLSLDAGKINSSFTLKYKKQTTSKNTTTSTEEKNKLKSSVNNKENTSIIYDIETNVYKQKVTKSNTKKTPQGSSYSTSDSSIQYQKYQNNVYKFDLIDKVYSEEPLFPSVQVSALADSYLVSAYSTIHNLYDMLVYYGETFGSLDQYKNDKFYVKGNVFTVITTSNYADSIDASLGYKNIEGTIVNTRQYILEKSYITVTKYVEYKKCSWENSSGSYKYTSSQQVGETFTLKLKGTVAKVYIEDFTFKS